MENKNTAVIKLLWNIRNAMIAKDNALKLLWS